MNIKDFVGKLRVTDFHIPSSPEIHRDHYVQLARALRDHEVQLARALRDP